MKNPSEQKMPELRESYIKLCELTGRQPSPFPRKKADLIDLVLGEVAIYRANQHAANAKTRTFEPKHCNHCNGTGQYVTATGIAMGVCYQCQGAGVQSGADQRRNWGYQQFMTRVNETVNAEDEAKAEERRQAEENEQRTQHEPTQVEELNDDIPF